MLFNRACEDSVKPYHQSLQLGDLKETIIHRTGVNGSVEK